jgi:hypothetical protein
MLGHDCIHANSLSQATEKLLSNSVLRNLWGNLISTVTPDASVAAVELSCEYALLKTLHSRGGLYIRTFSQQQNAAHISRVTRREHLKAIEIVKSTSHSKAKNPHSDVF